jgi:hypothetical protein
MLSNLQNNILNAQINIFLCGVYITHPTPYPFWGRVGD